jgi:hypothetical protein
MFRSGRLYNRQKELHNKYGGNRQSGIAPCANHPIVFLFTSSTGRLHGYRDGFISDTEYKYTGEGQLGDMELSRGNLAIKNHVSKGRNLFLFKKEHNGDYSYVGQFRYKRHSFESGIDTDENDRRMIVFTLEKIG